MCCIAKYVASSGYVRSHVQYSQSPTKYLFEKSITMWVSAWAVKCVTGLGKTGHICTRTEIHYIAGYHYMCDQILENLPSTHK